MLPLDSDVFSQYQMSKLLKKRSLQEEIDKLINELNGINNDINIELLGKSSSMDFELLSTKYKQVLSGRLASDEHTRFLLFKTSQLQNCTSTSANSEESNTSSSEINAQYKKQNLDISSQYFVTPNSLVDSGVENLSDYSRIEQLSQASISTSTKVQFQPKQLVGHLNENVQKLTKSRNTQSSTLDLSGSDSSTSDSEDFIEVEPLEDTQLTNFSPVKEESNAFLESLNLPYNTDYNLVVRVEEEYQKDAEPNALLKTTHPNSITTSIELSQDLSTDEHETEEDVVLQPTNSQTQIVPLPEEATPQIVDEVILQPVVEHVADQTKKLKARPATEAQQTEQSQNEKDPVNVEDLLQQAQESNKISRQAASVTKQMVDDCQELMRFFGVPWIVAPAEAEAQCAALEQLGLCDGVITDDSDTFLFGGSRVLRHFFTNSKLITQYLLEDLHKFFGLDRSKLICLGMLCGTDYTLGIDGIGPVTGLEVLSEFPGDELQPLLKYAEWYHKKLYSPETSGKPENTVRAKLLKFSLPQTFPSRVIFDAYFSANVDNSKEVFSWASPQLSELRRFAKSKFGWSKPKSDAILLPVLKNLNEIQVWLLLFLCITF